MKNLLIISPYFPPSNTADMHRIRMSLPYFKENGWEVEVVMVDEQFSEATKDHFLLNSIPKDILIHKVKAFSKKITGKFGLGSLSIRSLYYYKKQVDNLLKKKKFDLIYFSTTEFTITILGAYWKRKFKIPYVIDMQDPWHSTYYEGKPKSERPAKYWFSYRLNKYLEPIAMKKVDGLISVSQGYIDTLIDRYYRLKQIPSKVITFGAFEKDFELVKTRFESFKSSYNIEENTINFVYVGRGGNDMKEGLILLFSVFKKGLAEQFESFKKIRFHFIGTSYAPKGLGIPTIRPIAEEMGITEYVNEQTDRILFYDSIYSLLTADALLIIGSDDKQYTASKIYPYIMAEKPLLAFFHPESSASKIIQECNAGTVISLLKNEEENNVDIVYQELYNLIDSPQNKKTDWLKFENYSAKNMTKQQCELFNQVIKYNYCHTEPVEV